MQWFLVTFCLNVLYAADFMTSCNVLMDTWGWHGALGRGLKVRFRVGASPRRNLKFSTLKGVAFDLFSEIKGSHLICFPVSLLIFHWKKRVAFITFEGWCCIWSFYCNRLWVQWRKPIVLIRTANFSPFCPPIFLIRGPREPTILGDDMFAISSRFVIEKMVLKKCMFLQIFHFELSGYTPDPWLVRRFFFSW